MPRFFSCLFGVLLVSTALLRGADRPNILWITCEDTSPHLGAYGDTFAVTPQLDAFARQSVRYTQAFAYTGVCAPSRS
ncbi:MAG TPA: sulfatase-like hydrolase/transferase, partial [Opitutaceae bacterium]